MGRPALLQFRTKAGTGVQPRTKNSAMDGEDVSMLIVPVDMGKGSVGFLYIDDHLKGESREESVFNHTKKQNQRDFLIPILLGNYNDDIGSEYSSLKDTKNKVCIWLREFYYAITWRCQVKVGVV